MVWAMANLSLGRCESSHKLWCERHTAAPQYKPPNILSTRT